MTSSLAATDEERVQPQVAPAPAEPRWASWAPPLAVCLFTALLALIPPALGSSTFYLRGDSDAQYLPTWFRLGELVRAGNWPPLLDPASWHGGNYPAEALFGVYNPLNVVNWVAVSMSSNLEVAATAVKTEFLTLLALGVYLLCREYGAARWAASIVAVAAPFVGFTLYWEAGSWASGLIAFTYLPYAWWALRRVARGQLNPVVGFLVGALTVTQGNPYGVLGLFVVGIGLLAEFLVNRNLAAARRLVLVSLCVAALLPLVFWPLLATAPLAHRGDLAGVRSTGLLSPNLGDLFGLSSPTFLPGIEVFATQMSVPAVYFSWFVLPLLPWLRWSSIRSRLRPHLALVVVAGVYLLLTTGPTVLWLFRWPLRLTEYLYLPLAVALAVAMTSGFSIDRSRARTAASLVLVGFGFFLAWAQRPELLGTHATALVLLIALTAGLVYAVRVLDRHGPVPLVGIATLGTLLVLLTQVHAFPANYSSGQWHFPHSVPTLSERFASRYTGTTIQFADLEPVRLRATTRGPSAWRNFLGGSLFHTAGVDSVNTYAGVGLEDFTKRLCMEYNGAACERGYRHLWKSPSVGQPDLAELMKIDTIVLDRSIVAPIHARPGWHESKRTSKVVVLHPDSAYPWPNSRLSWASPGTTVTDASGSPTEEVIRISEVSDAPSTLVFARLGWPGYTAELEGEPVDVGRDSVGLLEVRLPAGAQPGTLVVSFQPPGFVGGLALSASGLLGAAALAAWPRLRRRRSAPPAEPQ